MKRRAPTEEVKLDDIIPKAKLRQLTRQVARHPDDELDEQAEDAVVDIAEDFLARMCDAAKLLAEHRAIAESTKGAAAAAQAGGAAQPPAKSGIEVKDFRLYLSRTVGMELPDFDERRWLEVLGQKRKAEKAAAL